MVAFPAKMIVGLARSGTSFLFDALRQDPSVTDCYFEPLNPQVWDDARSPIPTEDERFAVYGGCLREHVLAHYPKNFFMQCYFRPLCDPFPELRDYLSPMIHDGALLKVLHLGLRIPWLLENFPRLHLILLHRHPLAILYSAANKPKPWTMDASCAGWMYMHAWEGMWQNPDLAADFDGSERLLEVERAALVIRVTQAESRALVRSYPRRHYELVDVRYDAFLRHPDVTLPEGFLEAPENVFEYVRCNRTREHDLEFLEIPEQDRSRIMLVSGMDRALDVPWTWEGRD